MKTNKIVLIVAFFAFFCNAYAQFGVRAGVNLAEEIRSFSSEEFRQKFRASNFTAFQIGAIYHQLFYSKTQRSGFSSEIGLLYSQKGSFFEYDATNSYNELHYAEIPLNVRYTLSLGILGIYVSGGIYGSYLFEGKTINETTNETQYMSFPRGADRIDYGYSYGAGIELLKKIQIGVTRSEGLHNNPAPTLEEVSSAKNKVFTVNLTYLF